MSEFDRNILLAVDDSENSRRAVRYVAHMLGGRKDFRVAVVHVIAEPEEDYFPGEQERKAWLRGEREKTRELLSEARGVLLEAGFPEDNIETYSPVSYCPSLAECILEEHGGSYSTLVVGRKGRTRAEEFIFGSVSSKIVNHAKNCTVWVVE